MSIIPIVYDLAPNMDSNSTLANRPFFEDFGFGINPHEIFHTRLPATLFDPSLLQLHYPFDRFNQMSTLRNDNDNYTVGKDGFEVSVDVKQFKPNELTVKTTDNYVVVEGKHEEREDDLGFIQRHFVRKYWLPRVYNPDEVVSAISSDGVLTIKAPLPKNASEGNERVVQIQQTGTAHNAILMIANK